MNQPPSPTQIRTLTTRHHAGNVHDPSRNRQSQSHQNLSHPLLARNRAPAHLLLSEGHSLTMLLREVHTYTARCDRSVSRWDGQKRLARGAQSSISAGMEGQLVQSNVNTTAAGLLGELLLLRIR